MGKFNIGDIVWICRGKYRGCPAKILRLTFKDNVYKVRIATKYGILETYRSEFGLKEKLRDEDSMLTRLLKYLE